MSTETNNQSNGDDTGQFLFLMAIALLVLSLTLPLLVISYPFALFVGAVLQEKRPKIKFLIVLLIGFIFYSFIFGHDDNFKGVAFDSFNDSLYSLYQFLQSKLEQASKRLLVFWPDYPGQVRYYLWASYPTGILFGIYMYRKNKKEEIEKGDCFAKKGGGGFQNVLNISALICFPYFLIFSFIKRMAHKINFVTKNGYYSFVIGLMCCFYLLMLLIFGPVTSWHYYFGWGFNKGKVVFDYIDPWSVQLAKYYFYLAGALFPLIAFCKAVVLKDKTKKLKHGSFVGKDHNGSPVILDHDILNHHVHVVGASGFGKTTFLLNIIKGKIEAGEGVIFVDLKGDIDTICEIASFATNAHRMEEFEFFSISEDFLEVSKGISLFENGNALEVKDKIMGAFHYDNEYYKKRVESFLTLTTRALVHLRDDHNEEFGLEDLYNLTTGFEHLEELSTKVSDESIKRDLENLLRDKRLSEDLTGLRADLEGLVKTDFSHLFDSANSINLYESMRQSKIVYIHLDSQRYELSAQKLGRMILQEIKTASAKIVTTIPKENRNNTTLIVDEFSSLATEQFVGFLNRARASGIGIIIAHQELSDLDVFSPVVKDQIMTNTSTFFSFLQKLPKSAEMISGIAGTQTTKKETEQYDENNSFFRNKKKTGVGSLREVEEYIIHPNLIKNLKRGECFMIAKYPKSEIAKVFVHYINHNHMSKDELHWHLENLNRTPRKDDPSPIQNPSNNESQNEEDWLEL